MKLCLLMLLLSVEFGCSQPLLINDLAKAKSLPLHVGDNVTVIGIAERLHVGASMDVGGWGVSLVDNLGRHFQWPDAVEARWVEVTGVVIEFTVMQPQVIDGMTFEEIGRAPLIPRTFYGVRVKKWILANSVSSPVGTAERRRRRAWNPRRGRAAGRKRRKSRMSPFLPRR